MEKTQNTQNTQRVGIPDIQTNQKTGKIAIPLYQRIDLSDNLAH